MNITWTILLIFIIKWRVEAFQRISLQRQAPPKSCLRNIIGEQEETRVPSNLHEVDRLMRTLRMKIPWRDTKSSILTYNVALKRLSDYPQDSEKILKYMIQQQRADLVSLNTVITNYAKRGKAKEASALLEEWKGLYQEGVVLEDVDHISYNAVLAAFSKAGNVQAAEKLANSLKIDPDDIFHATMIRTYANAGRADDAEAYISKMKERGVEPSTACRNELLLAYSKDTTRIQRELKDWRDSLHGPRPDVQSFNIVLHALGSDMDEAFNFFASMERRDAVSYTTIASIFAKTSPDEAIDKIRDLVKEAWDDAFAEVDSAMISNIIYSLASCNEPMAPEAAEELVRQMNERDTRPDITVFNALLFCWAKSGARGSQDRVLELLSALENHPDLHPDIKTYTIVLDCLAKSREKGSQTEAEAIIKRMETSGPAPTVKAYTALIQNYARSGIPTKAVRASQILERMKSSLDPKVHPNIVSYNAVLNAAEYTDPTDEVIAEKALKVAIVTFDEIRSSSCTANHVTYGSFLGVLGRLMPEDNRQKLVELVFKRCCKDGQVSSFVIKKIKEVVADEERFRDTLGCDENAIPAAWSRNVKEARARDI